MERKFNYYTTDFETTVYKGQTRTDVWLAGFLKLGEDRESAVITSSIGDYMQSLFNTNENMVLFFHNEKFDGSFILDWLLRQPDFKQAITLNENKEKRFKKSKNMSHKEYSYLISKMGVWYEICISYNKKLIRIVDSLKLFPFSVAAIGEAFNTKHRKLEMEYEGYRYPGWEASKEELDYFINDLLVPNEALVMFRKDGYTKETIGSNCLQEFKSMFEPSEYRGMFPNLYKIRIDQEIYGCENVGEFIHQSYHGGWCYVKEEKKGKIIRGGYTLDVNSLYPSEMHSVSGNAYPVGRPTMFVGDIPNLRDDLYYFVGFSCRFDLREGMLPWVQIKGDLRYKQNEHLTTSAIYDRDTGTYRHFVGGKANTVDMVMTCRDFELFKKHYHVYDLKIKGGCYFNTIEGLFDEYIDKWMEIKMGSKGAKRTEAKLFLNNLYGRMAMYIDSSFKIASLGEDDMVHFETVTAKEKKPGYIAIGSAITSNTRIFTIAHAQANYDVFDYSDTDSLHLEGSIDDCRMCEIDSKHLRKWKHESDWDYAVFGRQKTYLELTHGWKDTIMDWESTDLDESGITVRGCGMRDKVKAQIIIGLAKTYANVTEAKMQEWCNRFKLSGDQIDRAKQGFRLTDFKKGLRLSGNLKSKRIMGGVLLVDSDYEWR